MNWLGDFHFLRPWWLLALLALPLLWRLLRQGTRPGDRGNNTGPDYGHHQD